MKKRKRKQKVSKFMKDFKKAIAKLDYDELTVFFEDKSYLKRK